MQASQGFFRAGLFNMQPDVFAIADLFADVVSKCKHAQ